MRSWMQTEPLEVPLRGWGAMLRLIYRELACVMVEAFFLALSFDWRTVRQASRVLLCDGATSTSQRSSLFRALRPIFTSTPFHSHFPASSVWTSYALSKRSSRPLFIKHPVSSALNCRKGITITLPFLGCHWQSCTLPLAMANEMPVLEGFPQWSVWRRRLERSTFVKHPSGLALSLESVRVLWPFNTNQ